MSKELRNIPAKYLELFGVTDEDCDHEIYDIAKNSYTELTPYQKLEYQDEETFLLLQSALSAENEASEDAEKLIIYFFHLWNRKEITDPEELRRRAANASNYDKAVALLNFDLSTGRISEAEYLVQEDELYYQYQQNA